MPHPPLNPGPLLKSLQSFDLPMPVKVEPLGQPGIHALYRLSFNGARLSSIILHRVLHCPGWDTVATEGTALRLLATLPDIPSRQEHHRLHADAVGFAGALKSDLPGESAVRLLHQSTLSIDTVGETLGQTRVSLNELTFAKPAIQVSPTLGFLPIEDSWRAEWLGFHQMWTQQAQRAGLTLGHRSTELAREVEEYGAALDTATQFSLVHRDLHPGNLLFSTENGTQKCTGVIDWNGAMIGDPLVDWLQPLQQSDACLQAFVRGYGLDRTEQLLHKESLARLFVYLRTQCVARLALAGMPPYFGHRGQQQALAVSVARRRMEQVCTPNYARSRLESALRASTSSTGIGWQPGPLSSETLYRRALARTTHLPTPYDADAFLILAAIALVASIEDSSPGEHRIAQAHRVLDVGEVPVGLHAWRPIEDRVLWRQTLSDHCLRHSCADRVSITILWLGLLAIDALQETVSDSILRGLERLVRARLLHEARQSSTGNARGAIMGGLAWLAFYQTRKTTAFETRAIEIRQEVDEKWDILHPFPNPNPGPSLPVTSDWPPQDWVPKTPLSFRMPGLLLALQTLEELPTPCKAEEVWRVFTNG